MDKTPTKVIAPTAYPVPVPLSLDTAQAIVDKITSLRVHSWLNLFLPDDVVGEAFNPGSCPVARIIEDIAGWEHDTHYVGVAVCIHIGDKVVYHTGLTRTLMHTTDTATLGPTPVPITAKLLRDALLAWDQEHQDTTDLAPCSG